MKNQSQTRGRKHSRRRRRRSLYRKIFGFWLLAFLMGFLLGRVVLAMERTGSDPIDAKEKQEEQPIISRSNSIFEDLIDQAKEDEDWNLLLVNRDHPIPEGFTVDLMSVGNGHQVDRRIAESLLEMIAAGKEAGHNILIISSYRTTYKQTELYENKVAKLKAQGYSENKARELAGMEVAIPGTSEHQIGLAVDLVSSEYTGLDEKQERTKSYQWLVQHCAEYGFILRYPNGKTEITGIIYEPWHFRYVGKEVAKEIMEQGICLEEYLESLQENSDL